VVLQRQTPGLGNCFWAGGRIAIAARQELLRPTPSANTGFRHASPDAGSGAEARPPICQWEDTPAEKQAKRLLLRQQLAGSASAGGMSVDLPGLAAGWVVTPANFLGVLQKGPQAELLTRAVCQQPAAKSLINQRREAQWQWAYRLSRAAGGLRPPHPGLRKALPLLRYPARWRDLLDCRAGGMLDHAAAQLAAGSASLVEKGAHGARVASAG